MSERFAPFVFALSLLFSLYARTTTPQVLPPWSSQTFEWGWNTKSNHTWKQCRHLDLWWMQLKNTSPPIQGPFKITFYLESHEPYVLDLLNASQDLDGSFGFDWQINLPTGGPYLVSMTDANDANGGVIQYIDIVAENPPFNPCQAVTLPPASLQLRTSAMLNQCSTVDMSVLGGTPPYTLTVVRENDMPKVVTYASGNFSYVLDVQMSRNTTFSVTDASGKGVVGPYFEVGRSTNSSCLPVAQTLLPRDPALSTTYAGASFTLLPSASITSSPSHGISSSVIAGGVVASVVLLAIAAVGGAYCHQRRVKRLQPRLDLGDRDRLVGSPIEMNDPPLLGHMLLQSGYSYTTFGSEQTPRSAYDPVPYDPFDPTPPYEASDSSPSILKEKHSTPSRQSLTITNDDSAVQGSSRASIDTDANRGSYRSLATAWDVS